ncbi:MAG: LPXTG cell wall anchor domain-containing protein [Clostridiales bacterium]|nr:LPXTG cell wall anchor domain-containing protein [Clostridiales bacterium]
MKLKNVRKAVLAFSLASSVAMCPTASLVPAFAATSAESIQQVYDGSIEESDDDVYSSGEAANSQFGEQAGVYEDDSNNTATDNDLDNSDIINLSKTGSITIHKYDITAAAAAGVYEEGEVKSTGQQDEDLEATLSNFGVAGVGFTILRVGNVETYSVNTGSSSSVELVYEIPTGLADILGLKAPSHSAEDGTGVYAVDISSSAYIDANENNKFDEGELISVANPCDDDSVYHYTSTQISEALANILENDDIAAKNALEDYLREYNTIDNGDLVDANTTFDADAELEDSDYDDEVGGSDYKSGTSVGATLIEMDLTDSTGTTAIDGLALGLYLVVETTVPEEIVETVAPFFIELPFTNTSVTGDSSESSDEEHNEDGVSDTNAGGEKWVYDAVVYPKNQSGNPTIDKSVRNAYNSSDHWSDNNATVDSGSDYDASLSSISLIVWNNDSNADGNDADIASGDITADEAYVANRGGYTGGDGTEAGADGAGYSCDFEYRDTTTASEGDVLDYIIVSRLPNITSGATYITEYTLSDILAAGITYNQDARVAFYDNAADAQANNTSNAVLTWNVSSANTSQGYIACSVSTGEDAQGNTTSSKDGSWQMTFSFTEAGLKVLNNVDNAFGEAGQWVNAQTGVTETDGLRNLYMVVYYTATVDSNSEVVLGDEGNANNVVLTYERTSSGYYSQINDRNYVYTYSLNLTKEFSDGNGDATAVQFKLYNATDYYYVIATEEKDDNGEGTGEYYVTGKTTKEAEATTFVPASDGTLIINGLEADEYALTEVATDDGYKILGEQISIVITSTDRDIIAAVEGVVGLSADEATANIDEAANIIGNYNGGIYDENGNRIDEQESELEQDKTTDINGNAVSDGISIDEDITYATGEDDSRNIDAGGYEDYDGNKNNVYEEVNGRTINGTDMYVGEILEATATVDGVVTTMADHITTFSNGATVTSENATVVMTVTNSKSFLLPQTGGYGLYLITIIGVIVAATGIYMVTRKSKKNIQVQ